MPKRKPHSEDEIKLIPNWLMLTTPSTNPLIASFIQVCCLTDDAMDSLLHHGKAIIVPRTFDEFVECVNIELKDSLVNYEGGLHNAILEQVRDILVMGMLNAQKLLARGARFAIFNELLDKFVSIWKIDERYKTTIMRSFETHYESTFIPDDKILPLNDEYNLLWSYLNKLCFEKLEMCRN